MLRWVRATTQCRAGWISNESSGEVDCCMSLFGNSHIVTWKFYRKSAFCSCSEHKIFMSRQQWGANLLANGLFHQCGNEQSRKTVTHPYLFSSHDSKNHGGFWWGIGIHLMSHSHRVGERQERQGRGRGGAEGGWYAGTVIAWSLVWMSLLTWLSSSSHHHLLLCSPPSQRPGAKHQLAHQSLYCSSVWEKRERVCMWEGDRLTMRGKEG